MLKQFQRDDGVDIHFVIVNTQGILDQLGGRNHVLGAMDPQGYLVELDLFPLEGSTSPCPDSSPEPLVHCRQGNVNILGKVLC